MTPRVRQKLSASAARFKAAAAFGCACAVVARAHGLDPAALRRPVATGEAHRVALAARGIAGHEAIARLARARQEACYLAITVLGAGVRPLAAVARVSHPVVVNAIRAVEEGRENARLDRYLDELELELMA